MFFKKSVLKSFAKLFCKSLFLIKETPTQVFPCEFFGILKNTFSKEHLRTTASEIQTSFIQCVIQALRIGLFGAAHGWERDKKAPLPIICHIYPTMIKRGTVTPYLKKIQKIYESRDTPLAFC